MQEAAMEASLEKKDMVIISPTGSGKTLAYLLPLVSSLEQKADYVQAMIIVPSRELALQIEQVFKKMKTGLKVTVVYGGHDSRTERNNFTEPPALLIGTPGRLADHVRRETLDISRVRTVILDEFDKSLEFGFETDMRYLVTQLQKLDKQVLTSATEPKLLPEFTNLKDPVYLNYSSGEDVKGLQIKALKAEGTDKLETLFNLICKIGHEPTLIFCNHRDMVVQLSQFFKNHKLVHDIYHGKLEQDERELAIIKFRNGSNNLLITTDLASRGLDIDNLKHVVHYQLPTSESAFVHRNGRTARMDAEGDAWLILAEDDHFPEFMEQVPDIVEIEKSLLPVNPEWSTVYISAGKKNKINRGDIAGLFHKKGNLKDDELGMISVGDFASFAAVKKNKASKMVQLLQEERVKNQKLKLEIVK